jgi:hypothetical protein
MDFGPITEITITIIIIIIINKYLGTTPKPIAYDGPHK